MPLKQPLQVLSLSPSGTFLAVAYGCTIQILKTASGELQYTTSKDESHKPGTFIRHLVWWKDHKLVSSAEDKIVKEWEVRLIGDEVKLTFQQQREIPKRANAVSVTGDGQVLVIADKFGDVYAFATYGCNPDLPTPPTASFPSEPSTSTLPLNSPSTSNPDSIDKSKKKHKTPKIGILKDPMKGPEWRHVPARMSALNPVLGHVSMLTVMLIQDRLGREARIITADRDEHIRVSHWPNGWEIDGFLLGQRKFVSALAIHPENSDLLLSAGGEDFLRIWSLSTLKCICRKISLEPFRGTATITVQVEATTTGRRFKRTMDRIERKRAKRETPAGPNPLLIKTNAPEQDSVKSDEDPDEKPKAGNPHKTKTKQVDLAIRKMLFVGFGRDHENEDHLLILSSVGSSILLAFRAPELPPEHEGTAAPEPQVLNLGFPILDITAIEIKRHLWVSLDVSASIEAEAIKCYEVSGDGELVPTNHATLKSLNSMCSAVVDATSPFPETAALYPEILLLSKGPSEEHGEGDSNQANDSEAEEV